MWVLYLDKNNVILDKGGSNKIESANCGLIHTEIDLYIVCLTVRGKCLVNGCQQWCCISCIGRG